MALRMHKPTLYPHAENDGEDNDENAGDDWMGSQYPSSPSQALLSAPSRYPPRRSDSSPLSHNSATPKVDPNNAYSDFLKRYRSSNNEDRNDPDDNYFRTGYGHTLDDQGDNDSEDISLASLNDGFNPFPFENDDPAASRSEVEKERLTWQVYLAHVLGGEVLKSEKRRIADALESSHDEKVSVPLNIWYGVRAKMHGRSEADERKIIELKRIKIVDVIIDEVLNFRVTVPAGDIFVASAQVTHLLQKVDIVHSLYPSIRAFHEDKPAATKAPFVNRLNALNTWSCVLASVQHQVAVLQHWTGSETMDVTQPNTSAEKPIGNHSRGNDTADGSSFVERVLKEESTQRTFEKGSLVTSYKVITNARDSQIQSAEIFKEMNLPALENEVAPLISFPTKLSQASLRVRLDYIRKIENPDNLILDQLTEDLKLGIGLACTLKRQYQEFLAPHQDWNVPDCISEDYDETLLDALREFFKLLHWKLKSGAKGIYFKETDVLEAQWATMHDVSMTVTGGAGALLVAEQLCSLTNRLMVRVINYFDTQVRAVPSEEGEATRKFPEAHGIGEGGTSIRTPFQDQMQDESVSTMTDQEKVAWYGKILDSVRLRYRKLQRFAKVLTQRFSNSAEYALDMDQDHHHGFEHLIERLVATDHFLVYTNTLEARGIYIIASPSLRDDPVARQRIIVEAFHVAEITVDEGIRMAEGLESYQPGPSRYVLILYPSHSWFWRGPVVAHHISDRLDFDLRDDRIRLVADGPSRRLSAAKRLFLEAVELDEDEPLLTCLTEQQAHIPKVNTQLRKIARSTMRLAESIVASVQHVRRSMEVKNGCQDLMQSWYQFASEHGQHALRSMDRSYLIRFNELLVKLAISWLTFICDDCDPDDRKTFKWAVNALEFTFQRTKRVILHLSEEHFYSIRRKVGLCIGFLTIHFDILGARTSLAASQAKERQGEIRKQQAAESTLNVDDELKYDDSGLPLPDAGIKNYWKKVGLACKEIDGLRAEIGMEFRIMGRVLDTSKPEDRSLVTLASSSSTIAIRWQQGRFVGAGAFGSVYQAMNLDSGSLMAVKEIKYQELPGKTSLYDQIKAELNVMEQLRHPNIVEYYGIEVHRDKVYIFEEYCSGGSLATLLEYGRIEDEGIIQLYTMQMLEGLTYLHSRNIAHRDIKPDNILLDHMGVIKFVDFGAAKILAKNNRSIQRSKRFLTGPEEKKGFDAGGLAMNNSLTGTPMYMSPEIIRNDKSGRNGAMDIWSLGCVVLECTTGKKPWSNLDNEWAIMFRIGVATQHPPLPEPGQLSDMGISFIKQCLTIDPMLRPSAQELFNTPWMLEFRETLANWQADISPPQEYPPEEDYENAAVAHNAAILREKEIEAIQEPSPSLTPPSPSELNP